MTSKWSKGSGGPAGDECQNMVAHSLRGEGFDAREDGTGRGTPLVPVQPYTLAIRGRGDSRELEYRQDGIANALLTPSGGRGGIGVGAVAFAQNQRDEVRALEVAGALAAEPGMKQQTYVAFAHPPAVAFNWQSGGDCRGLEPQETTNALHCGQTPAAMYGTAVRRLTPRECERLQGFPDDYTAIPWRGKDASECPDGPRYKALGNSMAVPVMRWIGERIALVEANFAAEQAWRKQA